MDTRNRTHAPYTPEPQLLLVCHHRSQELKRFRGITLGEGPVRIGVHGLETQKYSIDMRKNTIPILTCTPARGIECGRETHAMSLFENGTTRERQQVHTTMITEWAKMGVCAYIVHMSRPTLSLPADTTTTHTPRGFSLGSSTHSSHTNKKNAYRVNSGCMSGSPPEIVRPPSLFFI